MLGKGSGKSRLNKRLLAARDALEGDIERTSATISQASGERAGLIKRAAASPRHEQERIALTVRQLDREQERRRQVLSDLQRQQNLVNERLSQLDSERLGEHRKSLEKLVDLDELVLEAEARAAAAEEDRSHLHDVDEDLDRIATGVSPQDRRVDSILEEIEAHKELMEDERSGRIKAKLQDAQQPPMPTKESAKEEEQAY